jgi:hypothetical protein
MSYRPITDMWFLERQYNFAKNHPFYWMAKIVRNRAKTMGREIYGIDAKFLETLWVKQNGMCALSGMPMDKNIVEKVGWKFQINRVSVDRIDPSKGYVPENIQLVRAGINISKNARTQDDFIRMCCEIADHYRKH